jgi:hypothetical protein
MVDGDEVFALMAIERRRPADRFDGLTDEQWDAQSPCFRWIVREVAGQLPDPSA